MSKTRILTTLVALLLLTTGANASILTYDLSVEFSGATPPAGASPWLRAVFDDGGSPGSVTLTLTTPNLVATEFVSHWMFNLDPVLDPTSLIFSAPIKVGSFTSPTVNLGVNAYQADGDGKYDIDLAFDTSDGLPTRFGVGDAATYLITGIPTLTASSFNFLSLPAGGHGPFETAAHVQGIGPLGANSGWITVPEPATMSLLGIGGALGLIRRRRRN
ncbi:MAG: PEP-CTERM sorting domain-containing protein [Planctomycetota bacterium]|jgi:hypothetical protein